MNVYFDTIGCRLNQAEIERYAAQFRAAGHVIVPSASEADLVVVNTCSVTTEAASDSRQKVRQAAHAGHAQVILTGCWATLEPGKAMNLPGVTLVVPNDRKDHLTAEVLDLALPNFDLEPIARQPLPGIHKRTRAFIKVQDGCNNACSYCITRLARGRLHSETVETVLSDIRYARAGGVQEIVLTGVHLAAWGQDLPEKRQLSDLIRQLLAETDVPRLRLSSLEPWDLDEAFFSLWQDKRMCPQLHLPLQSGCTATLRRMVRRITPQEFAYQINLARRIIPGVAVTTDIIVGFPGETEEEFEESLDLVHQMDFSAGHVFHFSPRPGTPAADLPGPLTHTVLKQRSQRMRQVLAASAKVYRQENMGKKHTVLWERVIQQDERGWLMEGLSENYLRIQSWLPEMRWNELDEVHITGENGEILLAELR
ncbi:MAG TPA: tRNA (N(6)-L-threonylcarbamoyladenosine(37)-C(2))-methylthiotransferase MtaB [Longilinea sp.]|nr:tRNA (N(6)-L-threonylcarbamoyladenosine(37)-C(2))-methylthiotransferase MtaB [Longilinea sp.]